MTKPRKGPYVWVTWLSRLMAGETKCQHAAWFRTHYTGYTRAPSNFQLAVWTIDHTKLLNDLTNSRIALGETALREDQNQFTVTRPSGLVISGKPDLVTSDTQGHHKVWDAKTGSPRQSDVVQVMLYMMCLPHSSALHRGRQFAGCVYYGSATKTDIPQKAIDKAFADQVTYFLNILESAKSPACTPSFGECRYCDITVADCPDRHEPPDVPELEPNPSDNPPIPI